MELNLTNEFTLKMQELNRKAIRMYAHETIHPISRLAPTKYSGQKQNYRLGVLSQLLNEFSPFIQTTSLYGNQLLILL